MMAEPVPAPTPPVVETLHDAGRDGSPSPPKVMRRRFSSGSKTHSVPRLTAEEVRLLTSEPESLPVAPAPRRSSNEQQHGRTTATATVTATAPTEQLQAIRRSLLLQPELSSAAHNRSYFSPRTVSSPSTPHVLAATDGLLPDGAPALPERRFSLGPAASRPRPLSVDASVTMNGHAAVCQTAPASPAAAAASSSTLQGAVQQQPQPPSPSGENARNRRQPSPVPAVIPLPPTSLPTHLQLELAAQRPSPLYIHHSHTGSMPYESNAVKLERLKNVVLLAPYLERTLYFGALACLDAWLHTFTILPIRFTLALGVLMSWWGRVIGNETSWLVGFVWYGLGRLWSRTRSSSKRRSSSSSRRTSMMGRRKRSGAASEPSSSRDSSRSRHGDENNNSNINNNNAPTRGRRRRGRSDLHSAAAATRFDDERTKRSSRDPGPRTGSFRHRRTKSQPSNLSAFHKADLLQGAVIVCSSVALMTLDASRMYHLVRAQSAIKLYVIFNILEVGDRLLSALGQDILECLFSAETLSRNASGRSKVFVPLAMFLLALAYNCLHSIALYYQVITLNVAVNSYSNALLTLLLSNQFVEIKSTVFKRFEKDGLFQLTCADIVERFHLWVMLFIIGMRNMVEVGGLSVPGAGVDSSTDDGSASAPLHPPSILPHSFTVLPSWIMSGEVVSPFLIVLGSEMLVDAIKHAYVTKFNNIKPTFYSRTLDILCKDYYTNAFTTPSLTRRLGLAVIPLSCLFIRASIQTYHMFLSTQIPMPIPRSTQTSLAEESATPSSPAMVAALSRLDALLRDSLGRATYGYPYGSPLNSRPWYSWTSDDIIAALTMVVVFFIAFLLLLALKLLLGMALLQYARNRYAKMKRKEHALATGQARADSYTTAGRRLGPRAEIELSDDRLRWIKADSAEGLPDTKKKRPPPSSSTSTHPPEHDYQGVFRYDMVAKRIW
ncbi:hypothetical protein CP532_1838 [Ophiocordyceps camponoti-leonardi (nom. inval.)]|nr:hypothetical protein CP532_1838 [Ophiocordyceps camponoti-leonardi (nom. inval.)]